MEGAAAERYGEVREMARAVFALAIGIAGLGIGFPIATARGQEGRLLPKSNVEVTPNPLQVAQRAQPFTQQVRLRLENAGLDRETVKFTSVKAGGTSCIADWSPKTGGYSIGPTGWIDVPVTLSFISNCTGTATLTFTCSVEGEADTDSEILTVNCNAAVGGRCNWAGCPACLETNTEAECEGTGLDQLGGTWTSGGTCPEPEESCGAIPAVSEWGVAVMVLLVLTAGTVVVIKRSRRVAAT